MCTWYGAGDHIEAACGVVGHELLYVLRVLYHI